MDELIKNWKDYLRTVEDWKTLIKNVEPKQTGCGPVYELENPIGRPNESFALADMREGKVSVPHYHANGEVEIYFVLEGSGIVVVGGEEVVIEKNSVVVIPSGIGHYAIPQSNLVLAVVNTPPFNPANNIDLTESNQEVKFDKEQCERLTVGK
jgi:mannose-6-phosphate isomerase-like protein (cupin superfamily)